MRRSRSIPLLIFALLLGPLACSLPEIVQPAPEADGTSAALTVMAIVQSTQEAAVTISPTALQTPSPSFTPGPPTGTATETLTPTPIFTPTPVIPLISVSVPTNCRVGPGKVYQMVGALLVGETAEVFARDPTGNYWYIRNPDLTNQFCWVWGQYATLVGNTVALPVYTPPPTPTATLTPTPAPDFTPDFGSLEFCSGSWWIRIKVKNTGLITFRSVGLTLKDTVTTSVLTGLDDGFTNTVGCASSTTKKALVPEAVAVFDSPSFGYNPSGNNLRATITLCSDLGQNGFCVTKTILFTP